MTSKVVTIGPCRLILADASKLDLTPVKDAAIVSDPPYGMNYKTDSSRFQNGSPGRNPKWPKTEGDDRPFDPARLIEWQECIVWGSNHYAQRLPVGTTLVWLKKRAANFGTFLSDAEIGWQKGGHGVYCAPIEFSSQGRRSEGLDNRAVHPFQKPIDLMRWCVRRVKARYIIDPYMGSGTTALACLLEGRRFSGVEMVPEYFEKAVMRVQALHDQLQASQ